MLLIGTPVVNRSTCS